MNNLLHPVDPAPSDVLHRLEDIYAFTNILKHAYYGQVSGCETHFLPCVFEGYDKGAQSGPC